MAVEGQYIMTYQLVPVNG